MDSSWRIHEDFKLNASVGGSSQDIRGEMDQIEKRCRERIGRPERRRLRGKQRELRKELRRRESEALQFLVSSSSVVLATTVGAGVRQLTDAGKGGKFDLVVIDEAAQVLQ